MLIRSRRDFLRTAIRSVSAIGAVGAMSKFGEMNALAAGPGGPYQALVYIFLAGGNDGHNTVIPITTGLQNYPLYASRRGALALSQGSLVPVANGGDTYGLHPNLAELANLYNSKPGGAAFAPVAIVPNVGMLVKPTTLAAYQSANSSILPNALFSHSDQSSQWQTSIPTGLGSTGWGGRIADYFAPSQSAAPFPALTSTSGSSLFCTGQSSFAAAVPASGAALLGGVANNPARSAGMQQLLQFDNGLQLVQAANGTLSRGVSYSNVLNAALATAVVSTPFPANNPLAAQLRTVARIMSVRAQLGLSRQIFFCQLGGFDTHGAQLATQNPLLQQLSQAVAAFYTATQELLLDQSVVTLTASEFGRTLTPNSNGGTDHAWGGHHFVVGGGVQGGRFFGQYPNLNLGSPDDANSRGTLIPTTSVDQYGATIAKWFGVPGGSLSSIFPNIGNFATSNIGLFG